MHRNFVLMQLCLLALCLALPAAGWPQVYRCQDAAGRVTFSEYKCADDARVVEIGKPNTMQSPSERPFICPSGIIARVENLLYPEETSVETAVRDAEASYTSMHYRKAIQAVDPGGELPDRVYKIRAEGVPASEVKGFSDGIVINALVCK
jgi:hypothetical protein